MNRSPPSTHLGAPTRPAIHTRFEALSEAISRATDYSHRLDALADRVVGSRPTPEPGGKLVGVSPHSSSSLIATLEAHYEALVFALDRIERALVSIEEAI